MLVTLHHNLQLVLSKTIGMSDTIYHVYFSYDTKTLIHVA